MIFPHVSIRVKSQAEQVSHCLRNVRRYADPLDQYIYLMDLLDRFSSLALTTDYLCDAGTSDSSTSCCPRRLRS